ncbi:FtsX-like permease family protein [Brevibacterium sanguinis]|uniref:FtsX-like permease family protein n=2 Tax=Brevibacterium TaxID=1696 RepID=A0A366ILY0_9MICO|nr:MULTISPECIES: FtsX-like permease family protein [Brevibacterium]RBP67221.1 FtsX-like permease family protein [Brevibacterium sanguinis]RBP73746.1 FtsX-like permease family protein [Brevibacterium celere]
MTAVRIVPLVLGRRTLLSSTAVLVMSSFFACAALFLTVAAGAWSFFRVPPHPDPAQAGIDMMYTVLASLATVFLVIPASTLASASATLSARRQDERLSTVSLLGARRSAIVALAVAEPLMPAIAGIVLGVLGYLALAWPVSAIRFRGAPIGYENMLMPPWLLGAVVAFLVLVCLCSALLGLRKVTVSPLGVRTKSVDRRFPLARVIATVIVLLLLPVLIAVSKAGSLGVGVVVSMVLAVFALGLVAVDLIGGLLIRWFAHLSGARAQTPARLIAARLVSDEPRRFWRRVSGLAMTAFVAAVGGSGVALMRTGLDHAEDSGMTPEEITLLGDIFTGVLLVMGISILLIAVSALINQVADVHYRADTFQDLHAAGMDPETMHQALVRAVLGPVIWVSLLAGGLGLLLVLPLAGAALVLAPVTFLTILASVLAGILVIRAGLQVAKPILVQVATAGRTRE